MKEYQFKTSGKTRTESDLLGKKEVPVEALFGIQTLRCIENFDISRQLLSEYPQFIKALGLVKMGAIKANHELKLVNDEVTDAIVSACQELMDGKHTEHFPIDLVQGGAGTSVNMNANEVIANRALEIMGKNRGEYQFCHPNDHVNMAQSTNDAYPTAMHLGLYMLHDELKASLEKLIESFEKKSIEFADIIKMGRTQLQDAVPMTLGQSFGAYMDAMKSALKRLDRVSNEFLTINMGATAIGTGITAEPGYAELCTKYIKDISGWDIKLAENLIEATHDTSSMVAYSASMKMAALRLSKICNDLRLIASGPRTGLAEIKLPRKQPGSSIMPGKVNPVIPEVVNQVCFKVIGNDLTVSFASEAAQLELNVMEPVLVQSIIESSTWLTRAFDTLRTECIDGIIANEEHCRYMVEHSIGIVTALKPFIGYANSTEIAQEALESGGSVYQLVLDKKLLTKEQLDKILDPKHMIRPSKVEI
ncbi:MAG: aspartate ammonia-lyase [Dysgonamonadaceae bacterium]|nr:aspartate ammonia-lyase [Dysgonamonadaceae bacterium]MDD3356429.1 aspartate ammonia-lyase [Dysgonamonadaceae bacterium]MDD3728084.1 aspartate ammonia-lyase [Dysgonamonadaceae bacterium]MDD4246057.1 aspartate ammonia-lyase [Dysgonamonadaceae bacterium]MDD4606068.1 aspartate ammonia-lyase [Dysgonamonadaceae bacterium]